MNDGNIKAAHVALTEFNFIVCADASGSMTEVDCKGGQTRWAFMQETLGAFVRDVDKIDSDGLGLVIFGGHEITTKDGVNSATIAAALAERRPVGGTPLAEALTAALQMAGKSDKKAIIIVFTDGVPDNKQAVVDLIVKQANSQKADDERTILFIQVGHNREATAYLEHLDDGLKAAKFDIVDAKTIEQAEKFPSTADLVLHAIND